MAEDEPVAAAGVSPSLDPPQSSAVSLLSRGRRRRGGHFYHQHHPAQQQQQQQPPDEDGATPRLSQEAKNFTLLISDEDEDSNVPKHSCEDKSVDMLLTNKDLVGKDRFSESKQTLPSIGQQDTLNALIEKTRHSPEQNRTDDYRLPSLTERGISSSNMVQNISLDAGDDIYTDSCNVDLRENFQMEKASMGAWETKRLTELLQTQRIVNLHSGQDSPPSDQEEEKILSDPEFECKLEFAVKLGYSKDHLLTALRNLHGKWGCNELLSELIKLGTANKPGYEREVYELSSENSPESCRTPDIVDQLAKEEPEDESDNLRHIVIDGSNVAMLHGNRELFSCHGIQLAVEWFQQRGHKQITVFVPQWRKETSRRDAPISDQEILNQLEKEKIVVFTPARRIQGKRVACYDDRYVLKLAADTDGIVVSNDNYRDLLNESEKFKKVVEERLLMYSFVNDRFMPPDDPLGRHGPSLDNFLRKKPTAPEPLPPPCPYGKKCTYGNKCKYYHPERGNMPHKLVTEKLAEHAQKTLQEIKEKGLKGSEDDKSKTETRKGKGKPLLSRTSSVALKEDSIPEDSGSAEMLYEDCADAKGRQDPADHPANSVESRKCVEYNNKLSACRKKVELADQKERELQAAEKLGNSTGLWFSQGKQILKPPVEKCRKSPTEHLLSGHLLVAKKLSDEENRDSKSMRERGSSMSDDNPKQQNYPPMPSQQCVPEHPHQKLQRQVSLRGEEDPRFYQRVAPAYSQQYRSPGPSQGRPISSYWQPRMPDSCNKRYISYPLAAADIMYFQNCSEMPGMHRCTNFQDCGQYTGQRPRDDMFYSDHLAVSRMQSAPDNSFVQQNIYSPGLVRQNSNSDSQLCSLGMDHFYSQPHNVGNLAFSEMDPAGMCLVTSPLPYDSAMISSPVPTTNSQTMPLMNQPGTGDKINFVHRPGLSMQLNMPAASVPSRKFPGGLTVRHTNSPRSGPLQPPSMPMSSSGQGGQMPLPHMWPSPSSQTLASSGLSYPDTAQILPTDCRYNLYYNLCSLFPEHKVRAVMNRQPEEMDAKVVCASILKLPD